MVKVLAGEWSQRLDEDARMERASGPMNSKWIWAASAGLLAIGLWMALRRLEKDRRDEAMAAAERAAAQQRTWRETAAQMEEENERRREAERSFSEKSQAIWKRYDSEPDSKKTKSRLAISSAEATALVESAPELIRERARQATLISFRKRMAPLIRPESYAQGHELRTLVPSSNAAQCLVWGSMWANSSADDLRSVGFTKIACPQEKREWDL